MAAETLNLTGDYCINIGGSLIFTATLTGYSLTGASFESYIVRNFDRAEFTGFSHSVISVTNTGTGVVQYSLPENITSGLDYAASSWKSFIYPSGSAPHLALTGIAHINL